MVVYKLLLMDAQNAESHLKLTVLAFVRFLIVLLFKITIVKDALQDII
jgi:hypothetical protein